MFLLGLILDDSMSFRSCGCGCWWVFAPRASDMACPPLFLWQWRLLRAAFRDRGASCLVCDRKSFGIPFFGFIFHYCNGWCHMSIFSLPCWSLQLRCGTGTAVALLGTAGADPPPAWGEAIRVCGCHQHFLPVIKAFNEEAHGNPPCPGPGAGILPGVSLLTAANYTINQHIHRGLPCLAPSAQSGHEHCQKNS